MASSISRPNGKVNVGYFTNWGVYARNYKPDSIPVKDLTHLLYAFANIKEDGEVVLTEAWADQDMHYDGDSWNDVGKNLYGAFKQIYLLKKQNRHLKVLLSIGGWTYSSNFAVPASTEAGRQKFVQSSIALLENYGLDGLDIDWEYPKDSTQAQHYVDLLKALREGLDQHAASKGMAGDRGFELTIAAPCGPSNYQILKLREMDQSLSFWNLMAYDYSGSWESITGHQAALYDDGNPNSISTNKAVQYFKSQGISPEKLVIGIPLYGRSFLGSKGPGSPFNGVGKGSWEAGVYDYKVLPLPSSNAGDDLTLVASYCDDGNEWISFDSPRVAATKGEWIHANGLGGAMYWELSGDKTGDESLVSTVRGKMGMGDTRTNELIYSGSVFDNLRNGMA